MRPRSHPFAVGAAIPVAGLLACLSLGGLLVPETYARETPAWVAQAIGQDWFDLLVVVPWLVLCGIGAGAGSHRWGMLLAGAYGYTVYEALIYAFAVHFNWLFLVYCANLGLAAFGLIAQLGDLAERPMAIPRHRAKVAATFLIGIAACFGLLWLAEDLPAILRGEAPPSLTEVGLLTNPVHVIDLSFVLPAFLIVGVMLWRRQPAGFVYGPVLLAFGALMAASIAGMLIAIRVTGGVAPLALIVAMAGVAGVTAAVLLRTTRHAIGAG